MIHRDKVSRLYRIQNPASTEKSGKKFVRDNGEYKDDGDNGD